MATFSTITTTSFINNCFKILDLDAEDWGRLFWFFSLPFKERKILIDDFASDLSKRLDASSIINKPVVSPMDIPPRSQERYIVPKQTSGSAAGASQNPDPAGASQNTEAVIGTNCTDA